MSTTKVQGDMIDVDGATVAVVAAGDKFNFLDITDSLVKEDTVQGILDLGGGAWEFLSTTTASSAASVEFVENSVAASYDYLIVGRDIDLSGDINMGLRLGNGSTPTFPTSGYIADFVSNSGADGWESGTAATTEILFTNGAGGATAGEVTSFEVTIWNPAGANKTRCQVHGCHYGTGGGNIMHFSTGYDDTARATTGFQILSASGSFSGDLSLYRRTTA